MTATRLPMDFPLADSLRRIPGPTSARWPQGARVDVVLQRHGLLFELYQPQGVDDQQPHPRDELYVVAQGTATFVRETAADTGPAHTATVASPVAAGDALFVPAGQVHRFERFSTDFAAWVVFFGPESGA